MKRHVKIKHSLSDPNIVPDCPTFSSRVGSGIMPNHSFKTQIPQNTPKVIPIRPSTYDELNFDPNDLKLIHPFSLSIISV